MSEAGAALNPAAEPVVTILMTESPHLEDGQQLPLHEANDLFARLDAEHRGGGYYDKTRFCIDFIFRGEARSYTGRQDLGDRKGSLIDSIRREGPAQEFIPYWELHCTLSRLREAARHFLDSGGTLTPEQTAYYRALEAYVTESRPLLNRGEPLLRMPKYSDFVQSPEAGREQQASPERGAEALRENPALSEEEHRKRKAVNDYYRKHGTLDGCPQLLRSEAEDLRADMARSPGRLLPFGPDDSGTEIRRIGEQTSEEEPPSSWLFEGGRVEANREGMRLQIFFDNKPGVGIRSALKENGFRWSPKEGAWQQRLTDEVLSSARRIDFLKPSGVPFPSKEPGDMAKPAGRGERNQELEQKLFAGVQAVFTSEKYREYLSFYSRFHSYSHKNCILIFSQKPDASLVAGYNKWKEQGRQVRKGEKGITIFAPSLRKQRAPGTVRNEKGEAVLDQNGEPLKREVTKEYVRFVPVPVFDVSQTDGPELPTLAEELQGSVKDYASALESIRQAALPFSFSIGPVPGDSVKGFCNYFTQEIVVKEGMSEAQTLKTALHELAQSRLHAPQGEEKKERSQKEIEAESVAYLLADHFGLDTSDYSFSYVAGYASDKKPEELLAILSNISGAADAILSGLERQLAREPQKPEPEKTIPFPVPKKEQEEQTLS